MQEDQLCFTTQVDGKLKAPMTTWVITYAEPAYIIGTATFDASKAFMPLDDGEVRDFNIMLSLGMLEHPVAINVICGKLESEFEEGIYTYAGTWRTALATKSFGVDGRDAYERKAYRHIIAQVIQNLIDNKAIPEFDTACNNHV